MNPLLYGVLAAFLVSTLVPTPMPAAPQAKTKEPYLMRASTTTVSRRQAVLHLANSKEASSGEKLVEALSDKDPMSRTLAAQGIGKLKYAAGRGPLEKILASDPYPEVRQAAANSLRQIEDPAAVSALNKALKDSSSNVRLAALAGIARYADKASRPFVEAAARDKVVEVRRTAVSVLGRLEDSAAVPVVQELLKDSDASVRAGAAQVLGELRSTASIPLLLPLLKAPEKGVQASAARSLLVLGDESGFETARSLLHDPDLTVRVIAIDALGWSLNPAAETELQDLAKAPPTQTWPAIEQALQRTQQRRKPS